MERRSSTRFRPVHASLLSPIRLPPMCVSVTFSDWSSKGVAEWNTALGCACPLWLTKGYELKLDVVRISKDHDRVELTIING